MTDIEIAKACAYALRGITVTDPSEAVSGANADVNAHQASHGGLMAAIISRGGQVQSEEERTPANQLALGDRTITVGRGVCTHLAAAVVKALIFAGMEKTKIEIATTNSGHGYGHTFNTVNRAGDIRDMNTWGNGCIIVDIWQANQNYTSESTQVGDAQPNRGQGAFFLKDDPGYKDYLSHFGNSMGTVTRFG